MSGQAFLVPETASMWGNMTPGPTAAPEDTRLDRLGAQLQLTRFVVQRVLVPIIVAGGVTGNVMNIAVLTRRWMRSSTNYYLTILAVYDVLYLIFAFTLVFKHYTNVSGWKWYNYYKYHVGIPMTNTCSNTGVWMTLTFTIERYIGVCHPMKGKRWCTPERAKYIIIAVCTIVAIVTFPNFFASEIVPDVNPQTNMTTYKAQHTAIAQHVSYSVGYNYVTQVLFTFLPLLLLLVFNLLLIRAVMLATRQRRTMAQLSVVQNERQERHQRDQHRITVMLITVVLVFLLCHTPQAVQHIILAYLTRHGRPPPEQMTLLTITANVFNLVVMVNSSANFILYSAFSTKFRRTFNKLFCRCLLHSERRHTSEMMFSEAPPTVQSSPLDESRTHLLQTGTRGRGQVTYNWSRQHRNNAPPATPHANGNGSPRNGNGNPRNGYVSAKPTYPSIVSCV